MDPVWIRSSPPRGLSRLLRHERHTVSHLRRKAFLGALRSIAASSLPSAEQRQLLAMLDPLREDMVSGRSFSMTIGSHTNYWPYWDNYMDFLHRVLAQTPRDTDEYLAIGNRLRARG